jgi:hypothetical protein
LIPAYGGQFLTVHPNTSESEDSQERNGKRKSIAKLLSRTSLLPYAAGVKEYDSQIVGGSLWLGRAVLDAQMPYCDHYSALSQAILVRSPWVCLRGDACLTYADTREQSFLYDGFSREGYAVQ